MVEGHQCHRVAAAHRKLLVGHAFKATSPNGRFCDGAAAINNKPLAKIEVHGKNLFYFFSRASTTPIMKLQTPTSLHEIVHVHFGMSGAFKTMVPPGADPTATTRLRLENSKLNIIAHLSAMTVAHGDDDYYKDKVDALGPDPLREDADGERVWKSIQKCKKSIGLVLMDQSLVAGLGNIYRAEVLFKARVHPEQPASSITRTEFDSLWGHSVRLLQRGYQTGSIITVDAADAQAMGAPWTRRYVYNHSRCGVCKGPIKTWDMASRTVHACETCQVLRGKGDLTKARKDAMAVASNAREFVSHCAAEGADTVTPEKMTVNQLRSALLKLGIQLPSPPRKAALVAALQVSHDCTVSTQEKDGEAVVQKASRKPIQVKAASNVQDAATRPVLAPHVMGAAGVSISQPSIHSDITKVTPPVISTPKRKRSSNKAAACDETPDSKHAKQRRTRVGRAAVTDGIHMDSRGMMDTNNMPPAGYRTSEDGAEVEKQNAEDVLTVDKANSMKVSELKATLKKHQIPFSSRAAKSELAEVLIRMVNRRNGEIDGVAAQPAVHEKHDAVDTVKESFPLESSEGEAEMTVVPGTQGLHMVATAAEAAKEKARAGENKSVEHVALGDSDVAGNLL